MGPGDDRREDLHFGGRYYLLTRMSGPDVDEVELEDVGPGPGRGTLRALKDERSGAISFVGEAEHLIPIAVLDRFLLEVDTWLRPASPVTDSVAEASRIGPTSSPLPEDSGCTAPGTG